MRVKSLELDAIATRYGKLPHEIAALGYEDFMMDAVICNAGLREERSAQDRAVKEAKRGRR